MTPRQINAYQFLASKRRERMMCEELSVMALAAGGDGKSIKSQIDQWMRDQ